MADKDMLLRMIAAMLGSFLGDQEAGRRVDIERDVHGVFGNSSYIIEMLGIGPNEFCSRIERLGWVVVHNRGTTQLHEGEVTAEGIDVIDKLAAEDGKEEILKRWNECV